MRVRRVGWSGAGELMCVTCCCLVWGRCAACILILRFNKIDFVALNQGASGPNTAEVMVFDDNGKLVGSNRWNLATGVKAT